MDASRAAGAVEAEARGRERRAGGRQEEGGGGGKGGGGGGGERRAAQKRRCAQGAWRCAQGVFGGGLPKHTSAKNP